MAESAVEPTRSENITVTCRRSAASAARGVAGGAAATAARGGAFELGNRTQELSAMPERCHANLFEVLIGQVAQNREINIVLSKALNMLGHTELFEPVRNLLHRNPPE